MPSVTIRLRVDPVTKKKDVLIDYQGDSDALPMEHEEAHRKIVNGLIEGGVLKAEELGQIVVDRETGEAAAEVAPEATPQAEKEGVKR